MSEDFFQSMVDCLNRTGEKHGTTRIDRAELETFLRPGPRARTTIEPTAAPERPAPQVQPRVSSPAPVRPATPIAPIAPSPLEERRQTAAAAPTGAIAGFGWEELSAAAKACAACPLSQFRHHVVFGEGNPNAELMFVGEGPGYDEDMQGRPFVGKAGQLLDKMIVAMTFAREDVYIANIVKCRPPENRVPLPAEAEACLPYLRRQIELVQPKVIVTLGKTPLVYLLRQNAPISRVRGTWMKYNEIPVMPTFHPAYLLRQESAKREVWNDLKAVMRFLGKR